MNEIPLIQPVVGDSELQNVEEVLESGYMTQGPFTTELESTFTDFCSVDSAVATTSCTTGLVLALDALDLGEEDEVILPDFTYPATANAVVRVGAEPVLVDVDRETYNIDPEAVEVAVTEDTAAILPVSWGGQPLNPDPLIDTAEAHDLYIVEDAACAIGAAYEGTPVGAQFDASVFSFHPRKIIAMGEGGIVTTEDDMLAGTMREIKNFGTNPKTKNGFVRANASNYRLSDVLAAIGVAQMEKIDEIINRRRELAASYDDLLAEVEGVQPPSKIPGGEHNYQSYCVYIEAGDENVRDSLIDSMAERDIETQIGTHALHQTEAFSDAQRISRLETSRSLFHNLLTLPIAHTMTVEDQRRVVDALKEGLSNHL